MVPPSLCHLLLLCFPPRIAQLRTHLDFVDVIYTLLTLLTCCLRDLHVAYVTYTLLTLLTCYLHYFHVTYVTYTLLTLLTRLISPQRLEKVVFTQFNENYALIT